MIRIAAQLLYCSPLEVIPNGMVEFSDNGIVTHIGSLDQCQSEPQGTVFHNGILLPFQPDTQKIKDEGLKRSLSRQFHELGIPSIQAGEKSSLWLLSGEGLFEEEITSLSVSLIL